jgi:hypothetical protein
MGHLRLPKGKRIAVNLGVDFPWILELYGKYNIRSLFFTPAQEGSGHRQERLHRCLQLRGAAGLELR